MISSVQTRTATPEAAHGLATWVRSTALATLAVTTLDAFLLQQKKAFFTGGFLTALHVSGPGEAIGFLLISLVVDAGVLGLLGAAIVWAAARLDLKPLARLALVSLGALAPLVVWDFVTYSLLTHLGDAFDLGLMFDLTGRRLSEVFAVASQHLLAPVALGAAAAIGAAGLVWAIDRFGPQARSRAWGSRRLLALASAGFLASLVVFTAASTTSDVAEDGLRRKPAGQALTQLLAAATDFDGDGFGIGGRLADGAPFNADVYPFALDQPGNGIDENGLGGDLPAGTAYVEPAPGAAAWRQRPDVVLVVLESFRADSLGRTVRGRQVTPVLEALAREGVSSDRAFSHNGYTTQSRFHLMTGSLAGLRQGSLIDDFKAQGYETAYFSAQDESFGGPNFGVGFERADVRYDARDDRDRRYSTFTTAGSLAVSHAVLNERIEAFLRRRDRTRPLFLYVNFHDTHFPYHHREIEPLVSDRRVSQGQIAPAQAEAVREMYDNTAANVDRAVGAAIDMVAAAAGRAPAVIVTADHGESLFDEGFLGHGYALNDAQTRIPLIVRGLPMEIAEPFGQADLRDAVAAAMSRQWDTGEQRPRLLGAPGKVVFQYLGTIERPRQIAFASGATRLTLDLRDHRSTGAGEPVPAGADLGLIHLWERMQLARAAAGLSRDE